MKHVQTFLADSSLLQKMLETSSIPHYINIFSIFLLCCQLYCPIVSVLVLVKLLYWSFALALANWMPQNKEFQHFAGKISLIIGFNEILNMAVFAVNDAGREVSLFSKLLGGAMILFNSIWKVKEFMGGKRYAMKLSRSWLLIP